MTYNDKTKVPPPVDDSACAHLVHTLAIFDEDESIRPASGADTLREAAALMWERAESASPGPWSTTADSARYGGLVAPSGQADDDERRGYGGRLIGESMRAEDRSHIASWPPEIAKSFAKWLVSTADGPNAEVDDYAIAAARAYLGQES